MDKSVAAARIIEKALPHVPFDGWSWTALGRGAKEAGFEESDVVRVFPLGPADAVDSFLRQADRGMESAAGGYCLSAMKVRERIATLVRLRLEQHQDHKEALRRARAFLAFHPWRSVVAVGRTVDEIWHMAGDASTDYNWYTKRLMLAGVYASTLTYWLGDKSAGHNATWAFLDRRIEDVMTIERLKARLFL